MRLVIRPIRLDEIEACYACVRDADHHAADVKRRLLSMWRALHDGQMALSACIDDLDQTFGRRLVGFGIGAFVHPPIAEEINGGLHPYVALRMLEQWEDGERPFLAPAEIARANATTGLHFLNLHSGMPSDIMWKEEARPILDQNTSFMHFGLAGYRLNEFLHEGYGPMELNASLGMGFVQRTPLGPALAQLGITPPEDRYPYLLGSNASEAKGMRGTQHALLYNYAPPVLRLSNNEQEMLLFALGGDTDQELAEWLCISYATVRQRWSSIYEKVSLRLSRLFQNGGGAAQNHEKRRHVIQYIQTHREELRPYAYD